MKRNMKKEVRIGSKIVGGDYPTFVIAEAGINHQGDVVTARRLVDVAVEAGADAVKFQKRKVERILTREGLEHPYENPNSFGKTYGEHKRALELSESDYRELKRYADKKGIIFLASGWDEESVSFLEKLGVPAFKMASADLTNLPLLEYTAEKGKPMIISTGMANMEDVEGAFNVVSQYNDQIILLQCTSTYPSKFEDINLLVIPLLRERFGTIVGYSGHELGIAVPVAAVALGAKVIERHFTLDRTMKGGDHAASLEPQGLCKMVRDIRVVGRAFGSAEKRIHPNEVPVREKLAKSIVSSVRIRKGAVVSRKMLTTKGPGTGISPRFINDVVGREAARNIEEDVVILPEYIIGFSKP